MKVIIGSDKEGHNLKEFLKKELISNTHFEVVDVSEVSSTNFLESTSKIIKELEKDSTNLGIAIDGYGVGSFIAATKHSGIVAAEVSDERSAYMTREHNNSRLITLGSEIIGKTLAKNICLEFLNASYDGGRHQIRVDMLNIMK